MKFFLLVLLSSCAVFKVERLTGFSQKDIKSVCLNSFGKSRVTVNDNKYIFSFDQAYEPSENLYILGLVFPNGEQQTISFSWDDSGEYEFDKNSLAMLKMSNFPVEVDGAVDFLAQTIISIDRINKSSPSLDTVSLSISKDELIFDSKLGVKKLVFSQLNTSRKFTQFKIIDSQNNFKLEFIVRKCLETAPLNQLETLN